jgi:hypothetical protein
LLVLLAVIAVAGVWASSAGAQSPATGPGGPILVVTDPGDAFGTYYAEILRAEGLNEFAVTTTSNLSAATLSSYQVVLLAQTSLTDAQASLLSAWVQGGGNLIAMRPDARLAGLLGLGADTGTNVSDGYVKIDTGSPPGAGITGKTIQFHNTADRWSGGDAATVATLYADADTATSSPAVTLRNVGGAGGQAAAFTYDLARSVVYTRQGNPAWAGQKRDGAIDPIRSDDLFFPDWVDFDKIAIPQADEQQRLLANLITVMDLDRTPLPRFWYLPRGEKAAVVMTGDDHASDGGTVGQFRMFEDASPPGCSVAQWQCIRSTSYVYPITGLADTDVSAFQAAGFEIALHLTTGCQNFTPASLEANWTTQLDEFMTAWPMVARPRTNRTHCITWSDWAGEPKAELAHGVRLDANYYYWPEAWVHDRPGLFTGSGFPMRFADTAGSLIDVYQAATQMVDEANIDVPKHIEALLSAADGPEGYYGAFTAQMHTDVPDHAGAKAIVASARAHGVPIVSAVQMLDWLDGRNGSSFQGVSYGGGLLRFGVARASGATGLEAMVPASSPAGQIIQIVRDGVPVNVTRRTIKGIDYATFNAPSGNYIAAYGGAVIPTVGAGVTGTTPGASGAASAQPSAPGVAKHSRDTKAPKVKVVTRTVRVASTGRMKLRVSCPRGEIRCRIDLRLRLRGSGKHQLARTSVTVVGGKSATVSLRLTRADRLRLVRLRAVLVDAAASARDAAGNHATTTTQIRLLAPGRRKAT